MNNRVFLLIENLKMSQSEFAQATGVSPSAITQLKNSNGNLSIDNVMKIGKTFPNLSLEWLISGEGEMWKHIEDSGELNLFSATDQESKELDSSIVKSLGNSVGKLPARLLSNKKTGENIIYRPIERKIKKIIIFYDDGKFDEFNL